MTEEKKYPISEIFTSPQGEGLYAGTLMTFIRLAGCSVAKPFPKERHKPTEHQVGCPNRVAYADAACTCLRVLPIYTEQCTLYDGRTFECDTDYRVKQRMTLREIRSQVPENIPRICITGGEPLIHDLSDLVDEFPDKGIHLETSGTKPLPGWLVGEIDDSHVWLTVSPKQGVLRDVVEEANELKFLVDENFNEQKAQEIIDWVEDFTNPTCLIWIQPVNYEHTVNVDNMKRCIELQKKYPLVMISNQSHKLWGVR